MTAKRKLKRRVRERQTRTGERYTAARRQLLAERSGAAAHTVDEMVSVAEPTEAGATVSETAASTEPVALAQTALATSPAALAATESETGTEASATESEAVIASGSDTGAKQPMVASADVEASTVPVVQLLEVSGEAAQLGFRCRVSMFPALRERAEPAAVLAGLRDALIGNPGDPASARLFGAAFGIRSADEEPRVLRKQPGQRALQRMYSASGRLGDPESMITFRVAGSGGLVPVLCMLWGRALVLNAGDGMTDGELFRIAIERARGARRLDSESAGMVASMFERGGPRRSAFAPGDHVRVIDGPFARFSATVVEVLADQGKLRLSVAIPGGETSIVLDRDRVEKTAPTLFLIHEGRRIPIEKPQFVIGRARKVCDLALRDGVVSRKHAAVIHRNGAYYFKDLGSENGSHYKGMRIDNKRIDEGDVFLVGDHELRFTYSADG